MKTYAAVAGLFLSSLALALWLLGVFSPAPTPVDPAPTDATPSTTASGTLQGAEPKDSPGLSLPTFEAPVRMLVVGSVGRRSFTAWLPLLWKPSPQVSWQSWFADDPPEQVGLHSDDLPRLAAAPGADALEGVSVLIVADLDPASLEPAFWERAAERTRAGLLGVLLLPGLLHGTAMAKIEPLAPLLPVVAAPAAAVTPGGPVAGILTAARTFAVTDAGVLHPATRLTAYKGWTRREWESAATMEGKFATKFVHPVASIAPGASVLVNVRVGGGEALPAIVASDPANGRVLWVGGFLDVDQVATYTKTRPYEVMQVLVLRWIAWLANPSA